MKLYRFFYSFLIGVFCSLITVAQTRVACIGNSITFGSRLKDRLTEAYPAQLQNMLGPGFKVMNFGVSGATLLKNGNKPYTATPAWKEALSSAPDVVFIKLGTNDSKLVNRKFYAEFKSDYKEMIRDLKQLPSKPRIILLTPIATFTTDTAQIWDVALTRSILPLIREVAYDEGLELLDLHSLFLDKENLLPDKIHPDAAGAKVIADRLYAHLMLKRAPANLKKKLKEPFTLSSFYGYKNMEFQFKGRKAFIVEPKFAAPGHPWIWRARFWGHEPQTDIALLERGYHIAYCDASEWFGNQEAIDLWNAFYGYLNGMGLSRKVVLEGMSRGAVYAYNWAALNPKKVACVYADNPVLDLKSWPGGLGKGPGSKADWEIFKKDYGFDTDESARASKVSPIDKIDLIVKGHYPVLHVCGDADELVPMDENTIPFEKRFKQKGGSITVVHKKEGKHHPHSLPNPEPIVRFILQANSSK
jgi:lysophospholipase L1-like esterase